MKDISDAQNRATKLSKQRDKEYFVVLERDEFDEIGNNYYVTDERGLDTFYNGCEILYSGFEDL